MPSTLLVQPPELVARILRGASVAYIVLDVARVCRRLRVIVLSNTFWDYWRVLHAHDPIRQAQLRGELILYTKAKAAACVHRCLLGGADVRPISKQLADALYSTFAWETQKEHALRRCDVLRLFTAVPSFDVAKLDGRALSDACCDIDTELVECLLANKEYDPNRLLFGSLLRFALGKPAVLELLLRDKRVRVEEDAIRDTCHYGYTQSLRLLLDYGLLLPDTCLVLAVRSGNIECVQLVLSHGQISQDDCREALALATESGNVAVVRLLVHDSRFDADVIREGMGKAVVHGQIGVVRFLVENAHVDPSYDDCIWLAEACRCGQYEVVTYLLRQPGVDPGAAKHRAILEATCQHNVQVVEALLRDPRTDPATQNNVPLYNTARRGDVAMTRVLLNDARVDAEEALVLLETYMYVNREATRSGGTLWECCDMVRAASQRPIKRLRSIWF